MRRSVLQSGGCAPHHVAAVREHFIDLHTATADYHADTRHPAGTRLDTRRGACSVGRSVSAGGNCVVCSV